MIIFYCTHMKFSTVNTNINKDSKLKLIKFTLAIQKIRTQRAEWVVGWDPIIKIKLKKLKHFEKLKKKSAYPFFG